MPQLNFEVFQPVSNKTPCDHFLHVSSTYPFKAAGEAEKRRTMIISAKQKPAVKDEVLEEHIIENGGLSGILYRMICAAAAVFSNGFKLPPTPKPILEATNEYFDEQDIFGQWLDARCIIGINKKTQVADALASYNQWLSTQGMHPVSAATLKDGLTMIEGIGRKRETPGWFYLGFELMPADGELQAVHPHRNDNLRLAA